MRGKKRIRLRGKKGERGQTTLEFALTLILLMAFVLFFFQLSMVFAFGNYAHYATFMSARAYLSAGPDIQDQQGRARDVMVAMLKRSVGEAGTDRFPSIARGVGGDGDLGGVSMAPPSGQYKLGDTTSSWMQGVRYEFQSRLFILPLSGMGQAAKSVNSLDLTSESWLGHEPPYNDCQSQLGNPSVKGLFDNGC